MYEDIIYFDECVGIGALLVLMTIGKVELLGLVELLMSPKRNLLAGQIQREAVRVTLL